MVNKNELTIARKNFLSGENYFMTEGTTIICPTGGWKKKVNRRRSTELPFRREKFEFEWTTINITKAKGKSIDDRRAKFEFDNNATNLGKVHFVVIDGPFSFLLFLLNEKFE